MSEQTARPRDGSRRETPANQVALATQLKTRAGTFVGVLTLREADFRRVFGAPRERLVTREQDLVRMLTIHPLAAGVTTGWPSGFFDVAAPDLATRLAAPLSDVVVGALLGNDYRVRWIADLGEDRVPTGALDLATVATDGYQRGQVSAALALIALTRTNPGSALDVLERMARGEPTAFGRTLPEDVAMDLLEHEDGRFRQWAITHLRETAPPARRLRR